MSAYAAQVYRMDDVLPRNDFARDWGIIIKRT